MKVRKDELIAASSGNGAIIDEGKDYYEPSAAVKQEPIKVGPEGWAQ